MTADTNVLDLCAGAGLGRDGYTAVLGEHPADLGVDINPQPDYPRPFLQADVRDVLRSDAPLGFGLRHASYPCQEHTDSRHLRSAQGGKTKPNGIDLLTPELPVLRKRWEGLPWVVENVDDRTGKVRAIMAPEPGETLIMLCGTMFGLPIWRHRLFLANFPLRVPLPTGRGVYGGRGCRHDQLPLDPISGRPRPWGIYHVPGDSVPAGGRTCRDADHARECMGVSRTLPWEGLKEGFPPAYTSWIAADYLRSIA